MSGQLFESNCLKIVVQKVIVRVNSCLNKQLFEKDSYIQMFELPYKIFIL